MHLWTGGRPPVAGYIPFSSTLPETAQLPHVEGWKDARNPCGRRRADSGSPDNRILARFLNPGAGASQRGFSQTRSDGAQLTTPAQSWCNLGQLCIAAAMSVARAPCAGIRTAPRFTVSGAVAGATAATSPAHRKLPAGYACPVPAQGAGEGASRSLWKSVSLRQGRRVCVGSTCPALITASSALLP